MKWGRFWDTKEEALKAYRDLTFHVLNVTKGLVRKHQREAARLEKVLSDFDKLG